jgi:ABC-type multidrug transport system fused ATPase/permease subunit
MPILIGRELRWLLRQAKPYLRLQVASIVLITAGSWFYLLDPLVMKWLLDDVLPRRNLRGFFVALLAIFACYAGRVVLNAWGNLFTIEAGQKTVLDLRRRLLSHLDTLSADYHETEPVGARFYLFKEPMEEIAQLSADLLPSVLRTAVLTGSVFTTMLFLNARLTAAIVPLVPLFLFVRARYRRQLKGRADQLQQEQSAVSTLLEEHLRGITQLQLLTAEKHQERRALHQFIEVVRAQCNLWRTASQFTVTYNAIMALGTITVLGLGGREFFDGRLTIGGLVAFYTYLTRLFEPLSGVVELYSRLQRVGASIRKVMGAFAIVPSVKEHRRAVSIREESPANIEFEGVHFAYTGHRDTLSNLNFFVPAASRIALVGANGSGKSTIGKLMARLYDPGAGAVRFDGMDIRQIRIRSLREMVCYLPQDAVFFSGSLHENLLFANPTSETELNFAIELAELEPLLSELPGGLRGTIGPNGHQLSSGERQRVALARATLQRPRLMILDEATSFIDGKTEHRILSRLAQSLRSTTLVVISHHMSALYWAEEIFVLNQGVLVERGTRSELCARNGPFAELFNQRPTARSAEASLYDEQIRQGSFANCNTVTVIDDHARPRGLA